MKSCRNSVVAPKHQDVAGWSHPTAPTGWPRCRLLEAQLVPDAAKSLGSSFSPQNTPGCQPGAGSLSVGREGVVFCSWPCLGSAGSRKGTTRTRRDPRKILALLELIGVLHLTSARSRIYPRNISHQHQDELEDLSTRSRQG